MTLPQFIASELEYLTRFAIYMLPRMPDSAECSRGDWQKAYRVWWEERCYGSSDHILDERLREALGGWFKPKGFKKE